MDLTTRQRLSCCLSLLLIFKGFSFLFPFKRHCPGSSISLPTGMQKVMGHHLRWMTRHESNLLEADLTAMTAWSSSRSPCEA